MLSSIFWEISSIVWKNTGMKQCPLFSCISSSGIKHLPLKKVTLIQCRSWIEFTNSVRSFIMNYYWLKVSFHLNMYCHSGFKNVLVKRANSEDYKMDVCGRNILVFMCFAVIKLIIGKTITPCYNIISFLNLKNICGKFILISKQR